MPEEVKDAFGAALLDVQFGDTPVIARPFREGVPKGVMKLVEDHARGLRAQLRQSAEGHVSDRHAIQTGTGNVFEDLGLPEAQIRLAKAELARVIRRAIEVRGLTQREAASLMGLKQPDVSDLVRGRLARFSMERLELCLNGLDMDIRIQVASRPTWKKRAGLTVEFLPA